MLGHDMVDVGKSGRGLTPIIVYCRIVGHDYPGALIAVVRRKNPDHNITTVKGPFTAVVVNMFDTHSLAGLDVKTVFRKVPGIVDDKLQYLPFVARGEKALVGSNTGIVRQAERQMPWKSPGQFGQVRLPAPFMVQSGGDIVDQGVTAMIIVLLTNITELRWPRPKTRPLICRYSGADEDSS